MIGANNSIFFAATRTKEERSRILPEPPCCKDGKIIILLDYVGTGGMEQVAYDMANSFAKQGRAVQLASFHAPEKGIKLPDNLSLHVLDENNPEGDWQKLLQKEKCAAVFAHYCTRGAAIAAKLQIPYFQIIHNTYCWFGKQELKQYREADAGTTAYIAVSATVAWYAMECMKLPPEKMIIIENSVELERFQYSEEKRNNIRRELGLSDGQILFLNPASVYGAKGQLNLVRAFAEAYKKDARLRLLVAGKILEQKYFDDIQNFVRENNLQNAVIM
jgi:glycosyltransferase involved in cell wall biosynthesis